MRWRVVNKYVAATAKLARAYINAAAATEAARCNLRDTCIDGN